MMSRGEKTNRLLALIALVVALVALILAGRALWLQRQHSQEMEALGELIRRSAMTGRPLMDMGPPGGGQPELDLGD
jgi:hypothetical protein